MKDRTRILVTHAVDFLPKADHIILMDEGKIVAQGKYSEMEEIKEFKEIMEINDLNKNLEEKSNKDSAEGDTETDQEEVSDDNNE